MNTKLEFKIASEYWENRNNTRFFRYEDILDNPHEQLETILIELGFSPTKDDLDRTLKEYPPRDVASHVNAYDKMDLII